MTESPAKPTDPTEHMAYAQSILHTGAGTRYSSATFTRNVENDDDEEAVSEGCDAGPDGCSCP